MGGNYSDPDLQEFLRMLKRRRRIMIVTFLAGVFLSFVALSMIAPRYTARSLIMLEAPGAEAMLGGDVSGSVTNLNAALVLSELEVLRSSMMAARAVERLGLLIDPEINPNFSREIHAGGDLSSLPPEVVKRDMETVVRNFSKRLKVRAVPGSYAIQISYESSNPPKAAMIANTIADLYIEERLSNKFGDTRKVTGWLDKRLAELQSQLREAEMKAEQYRAAHNLASGREDTPVGEQLSAMNNELVSAKTALADAKARAAQVEQFSRSAEDIERLSQVVKSDLIEALRIEQARAAANISKLASRYGEKHPEMINAREEAAKIAGSIENEILKIRESLGADIALAQTRVEALESGAANISDQRNIDNEAMIMLRELERDVASSRLIYDSFLETYKRADNREELQDAQARVISYAATPERASFPNAPLTIALGSLLSLFAGFLFALLAEKLDNTYRSAQQLERDFGLPCFGMIPSVTDLGKPQLSLFTLNKPTSITAEAVRTLRMLVSLQNKTRAQIPRVIALTSSLPGEGKTTLALWLGRQAAKSGERVVIIDADMRKPNLHLAVAQPVDKGLNDYLSGAATLEEVLCDDEATTAHMIFARSTPDLALDLAGGRRMFDLLYKLRREYDLVIIDTPACLAVSDAAAVATLADQMLYAVSWGKTARENVAGGVKRFKDISVPGLGFVLTHVDIHKHAKYGYGDTPYYYGPVVGEV